MTIAQTVDNCAGAYFAENEMLSMMIQMDYLRPLGVFHSNALLRHALVFHDAFGGSHLQV